MFSDVDCQPCDIFYSNTSFHLISMFQNSSLQKKKYPSNLKSWLFDYPIQLFHSTGRTIQGRTAHRCEKKKKKKLLFEIVPFNTSNFLGCLYTNYVKTGNKKNEISLLYV